MKASKYLLLLVVFGLFSMKFVDEHPKVIIQKKLENKNLIVLTEPIYFVDSLTLFYERRSYEPAWNERTASQLIFAIQQAEDDGLNPNDYHLKQLIKLVLVKPKTNTEIAAHDILLSDAFLLFASHLTSGKVDPKTVDKEWYYNPKNIKLIELLEFALAKNKVNELVELTIPAHSEYGSLKKALSKYRKLTASDSTKISEGVILKKDMTDERIPLIKDHLFTLGFLKKIDTLKTKVFDDSLFVAVQKFQERYGLENDGIIGSKTIQVMNISVEERIEQIKANMERWRWLPSDLGNYYVQVNIPNYELSVFKNNKLQRTHKVIVGTPLRRTPLFSSTMSTLSFNPTWTVPPGILYKDVLPGIRQNSNYLKKKNLTVYDAKGNVVNPATVNWNSNQTKYYIFRQNSGPDNALGAVKFLFPNDLFIYIHDTPHKELFNKSERAFSSGCIRVIEPLDLAEYFLNDSTNWSRSKIDEVVETTKTQNVSLNEMPLVYLFYFTAWVDTKNVIQFRNDIYELDKPLIEALNKEIKSK